MPRRLKVFKTHIGFYDLVVAAPSMKAAAEAWRASPRLFGQGFAAPTNDDDAVTAALAQPGVVLKRPHGKAGAYKAEPDALKAPRPKASDKAAARKAAQARRAQEAAEKREKAAAAKRARKDAANELAAIEEEEAQLRLRRQALQKKFHLRSI